MREEREGLRAIEGPIDMAGLWEDMVGGILGDEVKGEDTVTEMTGGEFVTTVGTGEPDNFETIASLSN